MSTRGDDPRSVVRQEALELLYEIESKSCSALEAFEARIVQPSAGARSLVEGVEGVRSDLDDTIGRHATGWPIERMPVVDRCVLRLATFELRDRLDVPVAVVIDEAVELAKRFSTEESGRFVNGVLSAVAREVRPNR